MKLHRVMYWLLSGVLSVSLLGCPQRYTVSAVAGANGTVTPVSQSVMSGSSATLTVTPNTGFTISSVTGCGGTLVGNTYTTTAITGNCTVNAVFAAIPPVTFVVSAIAGANGTVSPATQTVNSGSSTTVIITPNAGFTIASVTGCGGVLAGNTYTTAAVTTNCSVNATFSVIPPVTFAVTASAGANGSVSPATQNVNAGSTATITVTPNAGFNIASVTGCGGALVGNTFTTAAVTANCSVSATFSAIPPVTFTVSASAGANGGVTPATQTVNSGSTATITVTPNTGFNIASVTGCGGALVGNTYTTAAIVADCAVSASFVAIPPVTFTATASNGLYGSISPSSRVVNSGSSTTFTVTPNPQYIPTVTGCGGTLVGNTYTTAALSANCTVTASFALPAGTNGTTTFDVTGNGALQVGRTSRYHVSGLAAPASGRPLIIYLHGDGATNAQVPASYSAWSDHQAAVIVAPQGLNATWNFRMDGRSEYGVAGVQPPLAVDDVAFIKEIITRGENAANPLFGAGNLIDPAQVFVVGESRGGGMAYVLYAHPDTKNLITAIAPVSGTFYCTTSNGGNGTTPYNPPADSDFTCGQNGGFGYFFFKPSLFTRVSAPRIFDIHGSNDLPETAAPALDNQYGNLINATKAWAVNSNSCLEVLPSANPVFANASINGLVVNGYRQRNAANTAPCTADVTFYIVNGGGHVPSGYEERVVKWFFNKYSTFNNTFTP